MRMVKLIRFLRSARGGLVGECVAWRTSPWSPTPLALPCGLLSGFWPASLISLRPFPLASISSVASVRPLLLSFLPFHALLLIPLVMPVPVIIIIIVRVSPVVAHAERKPALPQQHQHLAIMCLLFTFFCLLLVF